MDWLYGDNENPETESKMTPYLCTAIHLTPNLINLLCYVLFWFAVSNTSKATCFRNGCRHIKTPCIDKRHLQKN